MENYSEQDEMALAGLAGELNTTLKVIVTKAIIKEIKRIPKPKKKRKAKKAAMVYATNGMIGAATYDNDLIPTSQMFDVIVDGEALGLKFRRSMYGVHVDVVDRFVQESKEYFTHLIRQEYRSRKLQLGEREENIRISIK